jgi:tRNA-specific 2-thiouridylase
VYDQSKQRYLLLKSKTEAKDQTYVLYNLTQEQLSRTLMPVGEYSKDRIREIAQKLGLPVAYKPDSQEICFVEDNDYSRFIRENSSYEPVPGFFTDMAGNIIGKHSGIINYTVGQRKGLGVTFGKPMYVVAIDADTNTVVLGEDTEVYSKALTAYDVNYIAIESLESAIEVTAKIRYSAKEAKAVIKPFEDGKIEVEFEKPQRAVTPGQSVVFYQGETVIGGGIIEKGF